MAPHSEYFCTYCALHCFAMVQFVIMNTTLVIVFALLAAFVEGNSVVIKQHAIRNGSFKALDKFSF